MLLALLLTACGGRQEASPEATAGDAARAVVDTLLFPFTLTEEQLEGKAIFETVCWTCHGPSGHGDGPAVLAGSVPRPPDFTTGDYAKLTRAQLEARFSAALAARRPHPTMQYVSSILQPEVFSRALAYVAALSYPPEVPGSALAGAQLYRERCAGCHGLTGDGRGFVARQLTVAPADFTQDTLIRQRNFIALFTRIKQGGGSVHGSAMPAWGLSLLDNDIWNLVAFIVTFQPGTVAEPPAPQDGE